MLTSLWNFIKKEIVLSVSFLLAVLSIFAVPPDSGYLSYIDFRTLAILFCLMAIMAGLKKLQIFRQGGELLVKRVHTLRSLVLVLTLLCFFLSMVITNDVALITFIPFTIIVLQMTGYEKILLPTAALETCAANLGSMLLPMGNPQNLYLYGLSGLSFSDFTALNAPYVLASLPALCLLSVLVTPKAKITLALSGDYIRSPEQKRQLILYLALFAAALCTVLRILDYRICLAIVLICVLIADRSLLLMVDYSLLFTFVFLFIFIGNAGRISAVHSMLSGLVAGHEAAAGLLVSQCISNVPAALLLAGFSASIPALVIGVNLGGLGTLIASMANLISFKQVCTVKPGSVKAYLIWFTGLCLILLALLLALAWALGVL